MISALSLRVLVVEDDPSIGRVVTRSLALAGHSLRSLTTCEAARELRENFDCAVLDMDLPDGKGVDLATQLLSVGAVRSVVFFTASSELALLGKAKQLGPIVAKSSGVQALLSAVHACARSLTPEAALHTATSSRLAVN